MYIFFENCPLGHRDSESARSLFVGQLNTFLEPFYSSLNFHPHAILRQSLHQESPSVEDALDLSVDTDEDVVVFGVGASSIVGHSTSASSPQRSAGGRVQTTEIRKSSVVVIDEEPESSRTPPSPSSSVSEHQDRFSALHKVVSNATCGLHFMEMDEVAFGDPAGLLHD